MNPLTRRPGLTLVDAPEARMLFASVTIEPAAFGCSCSGKRTEGRELIITGSM